MDGTESLLKGTVLITGASGFTGRHACRYFTGLGMQVAAIVHKEGSCPKYDGVYYYTCDLLHKQELASIVSEVGPDYVLHLGGKNSVAESWEAPLTYIESNVLAMTYLLDALRSFPASRILIAGSRLSSELSASYRPLHPYGLSKSIQKAVSQSWQKLFGQFIMLAEPSNLIGPGPSTGFCSLLAQYVVEVQQGKQRAAFRVSSRAFRRDFLDVRDAVRAYGYLLAQGEKGRIYPVCSGVERSLGEAADQLLSIANSSPSIEWGESSIAETTSGAIRAEELESMGWRAEIPFSVSLRDVMHYMQEMKGGRR
ncbi:GDP-6-deoxy-D-mannose reductase [compost metagenome]